MIRIWIALALAAALAGCAAPKPSPVERIVLLPSEDGRPSAVIITRRDGKEIELNQPYASAQVSKDALAGGASSEAEVSGRYQLLMSVQPPRIRSYTLYFESNRAVLTRDSQREVDRVLTEAAATPAAEIDVIGHTDRRGNDRENDALGLTRAQFVATLMERQGFVRSRLSVQSRGEREPLVPTADGVDEPRNRRVEIRLR